MNVQSIIVSDLKKKLALAEGEAARIRSVLSLYDASAAVAATGKPKRKRKLSPELIAKMQAGRLAARKAKANGAEQPPAKTAKLTEAARA